MPPRDVEDLENQLSEVKDNQLREALTEIRREMRVIRKRQHGMAGSLQAIVLEVAVIKSRAAAWGAAGAVIVTLLGMILQWFHK